MRDAFTRHLLRRIALGLPVVVGPIVLVGGLSACASRCAPGPTSTTMHASTPALEARLGTVRGESFRSTACDITCRELDGLLPTDGGTSDGAARDVGSPDPGLAQLAATADTTCLFGSSDGPTLLFCTYSTVQCTSAGCTSPFHSPPVVGRAPTGLVSSSRAPGADLAGWVAETARLEAASVPAFEELALEMARAGAPRSLVAAARRSADDERRHAWLVASLAPSAAPLHLTIERTARPERDLEALALDNAIEGCVRESYGAIVAALQAERAGDARVREVFSAIARDEARHALLAHAMNDWALPRLTRRARARVEEARRDARAGFEEVASIEPAPLLRFQLGLPSGAESVDVVRAIG